MMYKVTCDELLTRSYKELLLLPDGYWDVTMQDGQVVNGTKRRFIYSHHHWRVMNKFPGGKLTPLAYIGYHMGANDATGYSDRPAGGQVKMGHDITMATRVLWDIYNGYIAANDLEDPDNEIFYDVVHSVYYAQNHIYNMYARDLGAYMSGADLEDFIQVTEHPTIVRAVAGAKDGTMSLPDVYALVLDTLSDLGKGYRSNGIGLLARTNMLNNKQIAQLVGLRGRVISADGRVYGQPITESYMSGLRSVYDHATESRGASLAEYSTDGPLKDSEYGNRRVQQTCAVIKKITGEDCGTPHYLTWYVGHVNSMMGKTFRMPDGEWQTFDGSQDIKHRVVHLKSITKCQNVDTGTACKACAGTIHRVLPKRSNLGLNASSYIQGVVSQLMMGVKHVLQSKESAVMDITDHDTQWFKYGNGDKSTIVSRHGSKIQRRMIRISKAEFKGRNTIASAGMDVNSVLLSKFSAIQTIQISQADKDGKQIGAWYSKNCVVGGKPAILSRDVLRAVNANGYADDGAHIVVQLGDCKDMALLVTARRYESHTDRANEMSTFLFSKDDKKRSLKSNSCITGMRTVEEAMAALIEMITPINDDFNLLNIEVLVRACMAVNGVDDFSLPRGGDDFRFITIGSAMTNRCVSTGLIYQGQRKTLMNPITYLQDRVNTHEMDYVIG